MVITTTLQPVASFSFRAASTAFLSSGLMMVAMDARFRVPSGLTATLPEVSGTCFTQTIAFIVQFASYSYLPGVLPEITTRWISLVPS